MVEAAPAAALEVAEPQLLLQLLEVALDPPAQLRGRDQLLERGRLGQGREPVLRRLAPRPRATRPGATPRRAARLSAEVVVRRPDPHRGEARGQRPGRALAPGDGPPRARGQARGQLLGRERLVLGVAAQPLRRPAPARSTARPAAAPRRAATGRSCPGCRPRRRGPGRSPRRGSRCRCRSPASVTTTPGGTPSASACPIWSSAIAGLVANPTSSGTPAIARRAGSAGPGLGQVEPVGDRQAGRARSRPRASPRPGSCPACRAGRSTAAPRRPRACPSSAGRCRRPARPGPGRAPASRGARRSRTAASRAASSQAALATKWCKRLVRRADAGRVDAGRHRLDALALARQQQAGACRPAAARAGRRGRARRPAARRSRRTSPPSPPSPTPLRCITARCLIWGRASSTPKNKTASGNGPSRTRAGPPRPAGSRAGS